MGVCVNTANTVGDRQGEGRGACKARANGAQFGQTQYKLSRHQGTICRLFVIKKSNRIYNPTTSHCTPHSHQNTHTLFSICPYGCVCVSCLWACVYMFVQLVCVRVVCVCVSSVCFVCVVCIVYKCVVVVVVCRAECDKNVMTSPCTHSDSHSLTYTLTYLYMLSATAAEKNSRGLPDRHARMRRTRGGVERNGGSAGGWVNEHCGDDDGRPRRGRDMGLGGDGEEECNLCGCVCVCAYVCDVVVVSERAQY